MVPATIARGRIVGVDIAAAEAAPGVHLVWTHLNVPEQGVKGTRVHPRSTAPARPVLENERVGFFGQPVAFAEDCVGPVAEGDYTGVIFADSQIAK